jgi:hypothetical protein
MIQRRTGGSDGWSADPTVLINDAADLQTLLEAIVRRYQLVGAVVASQDGEVLARVSGALENATDGFEAALAGDSGSLRSLANAIEGKALPRYFSQGALDAYADQPSPRVVALFMRDVSGVAGERSELQMVSDYNVAKEMTAELRSGMARLADRG